MARTVNLSHARTSFQRDVMEQIKRDKVCPFCTKNFLRYHTKPILRKGDYWLVTENFEPYRGSKCHLLAVSLRHATHFKELPSVAYRELFILFARELKKRKIRGGAVFMRFGNTDYTGGTVEHLHVQMVSGVKRGKGKKPLVTHIGYQATIRRRRK